MNYTGEFVADVMGSHPGTYFNSLSHRGDADTVTIPNSHLLFSGDYQRSGADLIVSDRDHRVVVPNYFHGEKRPTLVSPEGAPLDPKVVQALTGHVAYAQAAGTAAAAKVVGHVVKMTGSASIVRNGVTIDVNNGDNIHQNDVVQTGSGSTLGLVLIDGTTFNLTANARLMMNDVVYEENSTSNASLITLVQGAASFVAGQVAKTGDMKVATPVASIGIRGTAVILDISSTDGKVSVSVVDQQDGQVHAVQVFNTRGDLIGTVTSNGGSLTLTPTATFEVIAQESNKTVAQVAQEFNAFQQVLNTYDAGKQLFPNLPQHTENNNNQNSNPSPNTTKYAGGSPPLTPPGTEYHPPAGIGNIVETRTSSSTTTTVVVTSTPPAIVPTGSPTSQPDLITPVIPPIIVTEVVVPATSLPFVVTPPPISRVSSGGGDHFGPVMSADGQFVTYDPDGAIFLLDRQAGITSTIASPSGGFTYSAPTISADGHYIAYQGSDGTQSYVYIYNNNASDPAHYQQTTPLVSGTSPAISGDGSTIVVEHGGASIGVYDQHGHAIATITPAAIGQSGAVWKPAISGDGSVIAFWSSDSASAGGSGQLFTYDLSTGTVAAIASTTTGAGTSAASISADGHYVVYQSDVSGGHSEIYLYDLTTGQVVFSTANATGGSYNPVISPDGHFIIFASDAQLTTDDTNSFADTYVVDVTDPATPVYALVSALAGTQGNAASNLGAAISAGGLFIAFGSSASNFSTGDTPGTGDIFIVDPSSGRSAIIQETASSLPILTASGVIALTGDVNGVTLGVSDPSKFSAQFSSDGQSILWNFFEPKTDFASVTYGHDFSQYFDITLTADNGTVTIPVTVTVHNAVQPTITATNAAPAIHDATLTVSEGDTVLLSPSNIGITDLDDTSFTFKVTNVTHGMFQVLVDGTWYNTATFTTAELAAGQIRFMHDGGEAAPTFSIQADDGETLNHRSNVLEGTVNFTNVNDAPAITAATLVEPQGGTVVLGPSDLNITHTDSVLDFSGFPTRPDLPVFAGDVTFVTVSKPIVSPLGSIVSINDPDSSSFTFTVSNVAHGTFQTTADGETWIDATTFTTADLTASHVRFVRDDSGFTPIFSIQADDGATANSVSDMFAGTFIVYNFPPVITAASLTVSEGGTVLVTPASIGVTDPDSSSFTFTVTNVSNGTFQTTDGVTWVNATTFTSADLAASHVQFVHDGGEAAPTFSIQADDGAAINNLSNIFTGSVSFTNVNDAPATTAVTLAAIAEDSGPRTITQAQLLINASDVENNALTASNLQIASGAGLLVDNGNGTWSYTPALNDDTSVSFSYTITDNGTTNGVADPKSVAGSASLDITPVNDAPVITAASLTVSEGGTVLVTLASIGVTDPDSSSFTFTVSNVTHGKFQTTTNGTNWVDATTFTTADLAASHVQFVHDGGEAAPTFSIQADDGAASNNLSNVFAGNVSFTNVSDNPVVGPSDANSGANTVAENAATGTTVGVTALASDADFGAIISYSLTNNAGGRFAIDATTGVVTVANGALLDYETATSHDITVLATSSDGSSNSATFTIAVTDVNDNAPVITSSGTFSVAENATAVGTVTATDADGTAANNTVGYSIVANLADDSSLFSINPTTGALAFNAPHDYDAAGSQRVFHLTVRASDGTLSSTQAVTVNLTDVNDNAPVITTAATQSIAENTTFVATLTSTDADTVGTNPATFSITGGADAAKFDIVGGNLVFKTAPDFETDPHSYVVQVTASDGANTTNKTITVNLTDVNDNAPVITTAATQSVAENTTFVATLISTDADTVGTNPATFSITGGADAAKFDIVGGNLVFKAAPDFETDPHSYVVQVTASDGTNTTNKTITVNLTDVNDNAPVIATAATQSVNENVAFSVALASTDADTVGTNPATFTITGGADQILFSIDGTGHLTMTAKDFENPADADHNNTYVVQVTASDGANITNKTITVGVTDVAGVNLIGDASANVLVGTVEADTLSGLGGNDVLQGLAGNDLLDGGLGFDRSIYTDATGGIIVNLAAGTASGAGVGTDTLVGIEGAVGSDFGDTFNAAGFSGSSGVPGTPIGFNEFEGRGGNDTITGAVNGFGAALTRVSYVSATAGVTVDIAAGTADGDASVGHDTFVGPGILSAWGSAFADALYGGNNAFGTIEVFAGFGGNDTINGRGGFDRADYNNDLTTTSGIAVNLAAGIVTGDATVGTDTLVSVEAVRGTNFADVYDATGFSGSSTNAGSLGTFNEFTGEGGNDTIIGNGNTRLGFNNATAGVTVDINLGTADGDASVGHDTFTGVNAIMGSMFADSLSGSAGNETFTGLGGDDFIDGRGGFDTVSYNNIYLSTGGVSVNLAAGTATGDTTIGTDTLRSIEGIQGTNAADTFVATGYGQAGALNVGNNGTFNQFEGLAGNDSITGNGNTRIAYFNAAAGVTVTFGLTSWTSTSSGASGTATGDSSVGTDTFTGVNSVAGSAFDDTITGSNNPNNTTEEFAGRGGNDFIDGKGGFDRAFYNNDSSAASGINIDMASGAVVGDAAIGTDTLRSIESIRGTNFADTYVATGFGVTGANVGNFGTFNEFEGMGGNDTITGNGNTRVTYLNASAAVTVDLALGTARDSADALNQTTFDLASVGVDAFTGVNWARGSNFADTLSGDGNANTLEGQGGDDRLDGKAGNDTLTGGAGADTFVYADGGGADTITDFNQGQADRIDVTGVAGIFGLSDIQSHAQQIGANTVITFSPGDSITLQNVTLANLQQNDFVFADTAPSIAGDLAVVAVKGNGVRITGAATATTTADLLAVDPDNTPDQLTFTVTDTSHGHLAASATGPAITSFTQAQLNSGSVFFVADSPTYAGQGSFTVSLSDGVAGTPSTTTTVGVYIVDGQISVLTAGGFNFDQDDPISAMGSAPVSGGTPTTFTIVNGSANRDFLFTGSGFAYDSQTGALTAGTITSILETTHDSSHAPLASFNLNVSAVDWMNAVVARANGDKSLIEALVKPWTLNFIGNAGADGFGASDLNDVFTGNGGNDALDGQFGYDRAYYGNSTGPINVQLAAGVVTGDASVGTDTLKSIELVTGSNFADTFDATGFSANSANAGSTVTSNTLGLFNEFEGRGGNDQIAGNGSTRISYLHATSGVTVIFDSNSWNPAFNPNGGASGTAIGDASTGTDTFTGVYSVRGSNFDDVFHGSNNPSGTAENFEGMGGNDLIDGGGGFDRAVYNLTHDDIGIDVELAAGTVTDLAGGNEVGHDTLQSVEAIWGTEFADIYNAAGFSTSSTNAGSSQRSPTDSTATDFNEFEGGGGNDTITGNGNTRIAFYHATGGVVATLADAPAHGSAVGASTGVDDIISGVTRVRGSEFNDIITGNSSNNTLEGQGGNDVLRGLAGNDLLTGGTGADIFVYDAAGGNDRITDFNRSQGDRIDLRLTGISGNPTLTAGTFDPTTNLFTAASGGADTRITDLAHFGSTSSNSIVVQGVAAASFVASDFILAIPPPGSSIAVTVQTPDGYDFSTLYSDITASNPHQSANNATHIFAVGAGKTFELVGSFTYANNDPINGAVLSGSITDIIILDTTNPTQTTQDHVLVNTNGWNIDASAFFSAVGQYASLDPSVHSSGLTALNNIFNAATYSIVGSAGSADNNSSPHDGADVFFGGDHADVFNGMPGPFGPNDPGNDTVDYSHAAAVSGSTGITVDLSNPLNNTGAAAGDIFISIENLRGSNFDDILTGDGNNNVLEGGLGNDTLHGGAGDTVSYEHATAGVTVSLNTTVQQDTIGAGLDTLSNFDILRGSAYNDTLIGNGHSFLEGGGGNDQLIGQLGQNDTASYEHATSGVTVSLNVAGPQPTGGAGTDALTNISNLFGSQFSDNLTGNAGANILDGGFGGDNVHDTLTGLGGADTFVFNSGDVTITDFTEGQDHVDISHANNGSGFTDDQLNALLAASTGDSIDFGDNNVLTFTGIVVNTQLHAADFLH